MPFFFALLLCLCLCMPSSPCWANVNINLASETELTTLNGIGPAKAKAIVAHRLAHGRFDHIDDIRRVKGIGPALFERIKHNIHVDAHTISTPARPREALPRPALKRITPVGQPRRG